MCGRYTLHPDPDTFKKAYHLTDAPDLRPRWNIAPTTNVPVILPDATRPAAVIREATWGFAVQHPGEASRAVINARLETIQARPLFRESFWQRRCIVPANGFFEWTSIRTHGVKYPSWIHPAPSGDLFHFAGIWRQCGDGIEVVVLTESAVPPISTLHHRMPVFLAPGMIQSWLHDPGKIPPEKVSRLQVNPETVHLHPVSTAVNHVAHDGPELIIPTAPPPLQGTFDF